MYLYVCVCIFLYLEAASDWLECFMPMGYNLFNPYPICDSIPHLKQDKCMYFYVSSEAAWLNGYDFCAVWVGICSTQVRFPLIKNKVYYSG